MLAHLPRAARSPSRWLLVPLALLVGVGCSSSAGSSPDASGMGGSGGGGSGGAGAAGAAGAATGGAGGGGGTNSVTVLAAGENAPGTIVVDDTAVYWTTQTAVRQVAKAGGTATALFTAQDHPDWLNGDDTTLYWTAKTANKDLLSGAKTGGQTTTVASGLGGGLLIDGTFAYWIQAGASSGNVIVREPKAGGGTLETIASQSNFGEIVADDQYLYWAEGYMGRIQRVVKSGGSIMDIRPADPQTTIVARLDATDVYFATFGTTAQSSAVLHLPKGGGATSTLATGLDQPSDMAVTDDAVYVVALGDVSTSGALVKLSKADGSTVFKISSRHAYALALDAQYVYWTEVGDTGSNNGRVLRTAR